MGEEKTVSEKERDKKSDEVENEKTFYENSCRSSIDGSACS